jgi:hypothetical protein
MRECLPTKNLALTGYAVLSLLPTWVGIYSFFAQETLLLPLLGLSLWLSYRAVRKKTVHACALAAFAWGCASATKLTVLPIQILVILWMLKRFFQSTTTKQVVTASATMFAITIVSYLIGPVKTYNEIGVWDLLPVGHTRVQSGRSYIQNFIVKFCRSGKGVTQTQTLNFTAPSFNCEPLSPISDWKTDRQGSQTYVIDLTKPASERYPKSGLPMGQRMQNTVENFIFFWFAPMWPVEFPVDSTEFQPDYWDKYLPCNGWLLTIIGKHGYSIRGLAFDGCGSL